MSSGPACPAKNVGPPPNGHRHVVTAWRCNYSAFSGYHQTSSDYSEVTCIQTRARWRTKARYVNDLPLADNRDWDAIGHPMYR